MMPGRTLEGASHDGGGRSVQTRSGGRGCQKKKGAIGLPERIDRADRAMRRTGSSLSQVYPPTCHRAHCTREKRRGEKRQKKGTRVDSSHGLVASGPSSPESGLRSSRLWVLLRSASLTQSSSLSREACCLPLHMVHQAKKESDFELLGFPVWAYSLSSPSLGGFRAICNSSPMQYDA